MEYERRMRTPREGEMFAIVETILGTNKLRIRCEDGKMRMGRIPGKMRKRVWIRVNDVIIIKPWELGGDAKADVVWRYTATESNALRRKGILSL